MLLVDGPYEHATLKIVARIISQIVAGLGGWLPRHNPSYSYKGRLLDLLIRIRRSALETPCRGEPVFPGVRRRQSNQPR